MRLLIPVLFLMPLAAQPPQGGPPQGGEPHNLKVLKPEEVRPMMRTFTAGLGVRCEFCHMQGDFASDENRRKLTARNMIAMVQQINTHFGGNPRVTCYTCHRGETEPKSAPPAAAAAEPAPPGR
jgi:hypothetical protein